MSWGAVATAALTVGAGAASSAIQNSSARGGSMGYDMPMLSPAPWDAANQEITSRLGQNMALAAEQGRLSPGMELILDRIKKEQLRQAQEEMYGRPGQRGGSIMDNTTSLASQAGVGPKAVVAQGSRAMNDYAGRQSQIRNYIDSLKFSGLGNQTQQAVNIMQGMPRSAEIPYTGQVIPMNTPAQPGYQTGLNNVDWAEVVNNAGWFNQPQQTTVKPQTSLPVYPGMYDGTPTNTYLQLTR